MKCTRVEKFLPLHVAGDLAERRARAVENHLAACAKCRLTAGEHRASRDMFCAATLSPDFDGAFYEEIRNSVLARIRRDHTLAPPSRFSRLFDARLAYAASLSLLVIAAALALHSYPRRTSEGGARERMIAAVESERPPASPATRENPQTTAPGDDGRTSSRPSHERVKTSGERRANRLSPPRPGANIEKARKALPPGLNTTSRTPSTARQHPHALNVAATERAHAQEINAGDGGANNASPEVSRIEIQTSDPAIRIIWLSPRAEDPARPLK